MDVLEPPDDPVARTPARQPRSVRRTSHVDMVWDEEGPGTLRLAGTARDVATDAWGVGTVLAGASIEVRLDPSQTVTSLSTSPQAGDPEALLGAVARGGFRKLVAEHFPGTAGTPLGLLLDDVPVAVLIASYALLRRRPSETFGGSADHIVAHQGDLCAGWDRTGTMIRSVIAGNGIPVRQGPVPPPVRTDDPLDWHEEPPLPPLAMRRRRRIDVLDEPHRRIDAFFRDTWVRADGTEEVLHEYTVEARLDDEGRIAAVYAAPRVLPYGECPRAAAHVGRLVGEQVAELRRVVPQVLTSLSSCTHLNDLLRALADTPTLAASLP